MRPAFILAAPIIAFNGEVGLNLLARAATGCLSRRACDQHDTRMGMVAAIHPFGGIWSSSTHSELPSRVGPMSPVRPGIADPQPRANPSPLMPQESLQASSFMKSVAATAHKRTNTLDPLAPRSLVQHTFVQFPRRLESALAGAQVMRLAHRGDIRISRAAVYHRI